MATIPRVAGNKFVRGATPALPLEQQKFFDRQQMIGLYAHSGIRVADTIKTCRSISHGGVEDWIPSQSCAGIAAWQVGSIGLALGVGVDLLQDRSSSPGTVDTLGGNRIFRSRGDEERLQHSLSFAASS